MPKRITRGRSGGRKPVYSEKNKPAQANLYLPAGDLDNFCKLVPATADRNKLVTQWVRAYTIANGETDRLLAQSPLAAKLLAYLEATDAPEQLRDRLKSLIVQRAFDEIKITEGVVQVDNSLIILLKSD